MVVGGEWLGMPKDSKSTQRSPSCEANIHSARTNYPHIT